MAETFVVSDTHFYHANIIKYCDRPWSNVDEMNEALVKNWNSVVKPGDRVYHLGDVLFGKKVNILDRLHGKIYLIVGNHDDLGNLEFTKRFEKIFSLIFDKKLGMVMSHAPLHESQIERGCTVNLHGHVHNRDGANYGKQYFNCSVEEIGYTPLHIEDLKKKLTI